jgi:UDP-GlcNAc:undecaprenyl-phosphate GlcNAc-1-phosphate transferase
VVTLLATFVVRRLAVRFSIIVVPDDRRVHEDPTPTVGGAAMFVGLLAAMAVASQLAGFRAGTVLYLAGLTMLFFRVPLAGTTVVLSPAMAPLLTVVWVVGMANAVNLIDGLDGLAAGIVGIAALTFFVYSHELVTNGNVQGDNASFGPLIAIVVLGLCVGFLPHNFPHKARIFMGDAGAMLLGLLMAASTMSVVGQTQNTFSGKTYFFFAPICIPFVILGIPMLDTAFAIIRRAGRRANPAVPDKNHLHHRLMRLGHGHTRAVVILWIWTALLSALVLYPSLAGRNTVLVPIGIVALGVALYTLFAPRGRQLAGQVGRSGGAANGSTTNGTTTNGTTTNGSTTNGGSSGSITGARAAGGGATTSPPPAGGTGGGPPAVRRPVPVPGTDTRGDDATHPGAAPPRLPTTPRHPD